MKKTLFFIILLSFTLSCSHKKNKSLVTIYEQPTHFQSERKIANIDTEKIRLTKAFEMYAHSDKLQNIENQYNIDLVQEFNAFAKLNLIFPEDLQTLENVIKTLWRFDSLDSSRTSVFILAQSYNKYSKSYQQIFEKIHLETTAHINQKNSKLYKSKLNVLKEIELIMASFGANGNG